MMQPCPTHLTCHLFGCAAAGVDGRAEALADDPGARIALSALDDGHGDGGGHDEDDDGHDDDGDDGDDDDDDGDDEDD